MERWRRTLPLAAWLGALVSGLVLFHGLGQGALAPPPLTEPGTWGPWLAEREATVATVAILRLVVLALAWYLVGVTTVGFVARLVRLAGLVRVADALTLPMVRRLLRAALGVSLATAMVGASTAPVPRDLDAPRLTIAEEQPVPRAASGAGHDRAAGGPLSMRLLGQQDPEAGEADTAGTADGEAPDTPDMAHAPDRADGDPEAVHEVVAGESLWSIARDALARRWDRAPTDAEVVGYWRVVIERNRPALADPDDPDLIFPGDEIALPAAADHA